jgi:hypothetical protein
LRYLRYVSDERAIWIDALCINQYDTFERNQQVAKMRDIYQRALKVVVWLGAESEDSNTAFQFLAEASLNKSEIEHWVRRQWKGLVHRKHWLAIYRLLSRNYWNRIWIVQEIFFAQCPMVRCGFRCIRWSDFILLFHYILTCARIVEQGIESDGNRIEKMANGSMFRALIDKSYIPTVIELNRNMRLSGVDPDLEILLTKFRRCSSTDPRDKVLGILGMAGHYGDEREHKVDYALSKRETYIETIRCLIERRIHLRLNPLNVILFSFPHYSDGSLPSWVPDWSLAPGSCADADSGILSDGSNANGNLATVAKIRIDIYKGILTVESLEIATVHQLGALPQTSLDEPPFDMQGLATSFRDIETIRAAFFTALKLALSDSNSMPHGRKPLDTKMKEFALTMICNTYDNYSLDPSIASETDQKSVRPSEETTREFCELIHFLETHTTLNDWENVLKDTRHASNWLLFPSAIINLRLARFCVSSIGSFIMAPQSVRRGDVIFVLIGCDVPVVLRKQAENEYTFVGKCYAHGIMDGEAIKDMLDGKCTTKTIRIL